MNTKIYKVFHASLPKVPGIKRFIHDYSFPIIVTVVFLIVATGASLLRASQNSSLTDLLVDVTSRDQAYGTLLSKDKTDELKKNEEIPQPSVGTPTGTSTSFAINTGSATSPAPAGTTAASLAHVFSASIAGFQQNSATLVCSNPKPKIQTCSKRYEYSGTIRTKNGPGTVRYDWRSNLQSAIEDGSVAAGGGDAQSSVQKVITLACNNPTSFSLQLVLTSPSFTQSAVLNVNHNCNEI